MMSNQYTIEGLSTKQKVLCDVMWRLATRDSIIAFVNTLPFPDRKEAASIIQLMQWSFIDNIESVEDAADILKEYTLRG